MTATVLYMMMDGLHYYYSTVDYRYVHLHTYYASGVRSHVYKPMKFEVCLYPSGALDGIVTGTYV